MAIDIQKLVAAIAPDVYCDKSVRKEVKEIAKKEGYAAAAKKAKFVSQDELFSVESAKSKPLEAPGIKAPFEIHKLVYDSPSESLEPIYFWILDFLQGPFGRGKIEKLVDSFMASPGSAHFAEQGMKATRMQEEASKILGNVNTVLKSILNIIYDLKEFKLRIETYDSYKNSKGPEKNAYLLALKQVWLDNVDIKRGNTALKAMAQQYDYVTLIDAFMASSSLEMAMKSPDEGGIDLNERVRRILQQRLAEFFKWIDLSEVELKKRFEIERKYLQSQVNALKLYSRWVKPYLNAARRLEQDESLSSNAALVTTFNTLLMQLTVLAQNTYDPSDDVATGDLPDFFKDVTKKKYTVCLLVDFRFRGIPQRAGQGFTFGGRTDISFMGFALTDAELEILKKEMEKDDFNDMLKLINGATEDSLKEIEKDIEDFLGDKKEEDEDEKNKESDNDINPFSSLFSGFSWFNKDKKSDDKSKELTPDSKYESIIRSQAIIDAREKCNTLFDTYKKAHGMSAF